METDPAPDQPPGILCPTCLRANASDTDFCVQCGAPLSSIATIDPLKSTLSEGFGYRQAVDGPPSLLVVIGIWAIFVPGLVAVLISFVQTGRAPDYLSSGLSVGYSCLGVFVLYRSTANYLRKRAAVLSPPLAPDDE